MNNELGTPKRNEISSGEILGFWKIGGLAKISPKREAIFVLKNILSFLRFVVEI